MDTIDSIIENIVRREGGYSNNPADKGGRTMYGITERDFPGAWKDGVVTLEEAKAIYRKKFVEGPGFDKIPDIHLMEQVIDFGVNSGPGLATQKLQTILGVEADGKLGPATLHALAQRDDREVGNLLVGERIKMFVRIVTRDKSQLQFLAGWVNRATAFLR
jgi:lysozyme family protein